MLRLQKHISRKVTITSHVSQKLFTAKESLFKNLTKIIAWYEIELCLKELQVIWLQSGLASSAHSSAAQGYFSRNY